MDYDKEEFARIKEAAKKIQANSEVLVVIGIGGSYLGARAAIEFVTHSFNNQLPKEVRKAPEIYFAGNNISSKYLPDIPVGYIGSIETAANNMTKYGTITPVADFQHLQEVLVILETKRQIPEEE